MYNEVTRPCDSTRVRCITIETQDKDCCLLSVDLKKHDNKKRHTSDLRLT